MTAWPAVGTQPATPPKSLYQKERTVKLRHTNIIIVARSIRRDGSRSIVVLPVTLNLSIGLFVAFVNVALSTFTTFDFMVGKPLRWLAWAYDLLFVGWGDDWPIIWLAIKAMFGGAYVRA